MSSTHTPGRLELRDESKFGGRPFMIGSEDTTDTVAEVINENWRHAEGDARRLVACWNFCEGIETDAIESFSANLAAMLEGVKVEAELITTWRQRAQQAVDALAKVETYLQERVGSNPGSRGATVILPMIRAAIEGAGVAPTQSTWADC